MAPPNKKKRQKVRQQKAIDTSSLSLWDQEFEEAMQKQLVPPAEWAGVFCNPRKQPLANYLPRPDERVISNPQGSYICMGSDNLGGAWTGYGGDGETRASKIDLVCGRNGSKSNPNQDVDPLPFYDSARIYISEKTDCDKNFKLAEGKVGQSVAKSAIVLKADAVRVVGREGVKIISGIGVPDESNALGGAITKGGIDLIAGNIDSGEYELQNLVKGQNLIEFIKKSLIEDIKDIVSVMNRFIMWQLQFNAQTSLHMHVSPFVGAPTSNSPLLITPAQAMAKNSAEAMHDLLKINTNMLFSLTSTYLLPDGNGYILSKHNSTN
jgi:hypothetical protein